MLTSGCKARKMGLTDRALLGDDEPGGDTVATVNPELKKLRT